MLEKLEVLKTRRFLYEVLTNGVHVFLGYVSAKIPLLGIVIAAVFTAYEYLTSRTPLEVLTDYTEFIIGVLLGLA